MWFFSPCVSLFFFYLRPSEVTDSEHAGKELEKSSEQTMDQKIVIEQ